MNVSTLGRSLPDSALSLWRGLRWRTRAVLALLAVGLAVLGFFMIRRPIDEWPARAVLKTPGDTWSLAFSPDGRTFLTSGPEGIMPWDTSNGQPGDLWPIKDQKFALTGTYSPDGRTFAVAIFRHPELVTIHLIDTTTGRTRATIKTQHPTVYKLAYTPDGRTLRTFLGDSGHLKEVVTWVASTGEQTSSRAITAPTKLSVTAISPDGRLLALTPHRSRSIQLWDLEGDRTAGSLSNPSKSGLLALGMGFSADGKILAIGRDDGSIDLWDVPGRKLLKTLPIHSDGYASEGIRFSPDGQTLSSTGNRTGQKSALLQIQDIFGRTLSGKARGEGFEVVVLDIGTGKPIARASSSLHPMYSPDGRTIATRQEDLSVKLRDLPALTPRDDPSNHRGRP